jgi:hypothetical protein
MLQLQAVNMTERYVMKSNKLKYITFMFSGMFAFSQIFAQQAIGSEMEEAERMFAASSAVVENERQEMSLRLTVVSGMMSSYTAMVGAEYFFEIFVKPSFRDDISAISKVEKII